MRNIIRYHGYRRITDEQESTQSAVVLDAGEIRDLPMEDIRMILRGADELTSTGGRSMLAKILKGSRDKKILEYKLNECPAYGYYHDMKLDDIATAEDMDTELNLMDPQLWESFALQQQS